MPQYLYQYTYTVYIVKENILTYNTDILKLINYRKRIYVML